MRLIDADKLQRDLKNQIPAMSNWGETFVPALVSEQPTVDAVSVVRCRECVYFDPDDEDGLRCAKTEAMLWSSENDYCSYGQRKDQFADVRKKEGIPDAAKETT